MPKNTSFLAPHPEKIRIFMKRNDETTIENISNFTGKAGKRVRVLPARRG